MLVEMMDGGIELLSHVARKHVSLLRAKGTDESSEVPCWDWTCGLCSSKGVLAEVLAFTFGLVPLNLDHISPADMVFRDSDGQTFAQLPEDTSPFRVQKEHDGATGATGVHEDARSCNSSYP